MAVEGQPSNPISRPELEQIPWQEIEVGAVEDFSTFMWECWNPEPGSWPSPMFFAELTHAGKKIGSIYHVDSTSATYPETEILHLRHSLDGLRKGTVFHTSYKLCLGVKIGAHHLQAFAEAYQDDNIPEVFFCHAGDLPDGYLGFFEHGRYLDLSPEQFAGIYAGVKHLLAFVRPHLRKEDDVRADDEYGFFLKETGQEPDPLLREMVPHIGSKGHVEFVRRNQIVKTLLRNIEAAEPLSQLAAAQAAQAMGVAEPALERNADGKIQDIVNYQRFLNQFIELRCPWFDPVEEFELVYLEDFSIYMPVASSAGSKSSEETLVPMFLAELQRKWGPASTELVFCFNFSWPAELTHDSYVGFRSGWSEASIRWFMIHKDSAHLTTAEDLHGGSPVDGTPVMRKRVFLSDLSEARWSPRYAKPPESNEVKPGTPEWDLQWADYRRFMRVLREKLGDPRDPEHPAKKKYVDYLKETGTKPDPLLKDALVHIKSMNYAELYKRHRVCLILARSLKATEGAFTELALDEVAREINWPKPSMARNPDGSLADASSRYCFKNFADEYIRLRCPWYINLKKFMQSYRLS
jgi:hypothetical protein